MKLEAQAQGLSCENHNSAARYKLTGINATSPDKNNLLLQKK